MSQSTITDTVEGLPGREREIAAAQQDKLTWETPKMEDVSEQVMAQPYIRFT